LKIGTSKSVEKRGRERDGARVAQNCQMGEKEILGIPAVKTIPVKSRSK